VARQPTDYVRGEDFASFMRAYQDMVFTTATRIAGDARQAEDIAQEVFLKAYENFAHLSVSPTAGGWLKAVTRNLTLNHVQRYRRRWRFFSEFRREDQDSDEPEIEFALPDDLVADVNADVSRQLVDEALRSLPEHQRLPLVLYHFEEMPYEDIAQQLGISLAKVKTDIFRARAALAKRLLRSGVTAADTLSAS
jgi:RNA polymerase sigma-70 factor, ECF subfamily